MAQYVSGITINLIKKKYRDIKVSKSIEDLDIEIANNEDIEFNIVQDKYYEDMLKVLDSMKREDKEIFMLYYFNSLDIKAISNKMDMSQSKIKSKLFRARKKLRKYLKGKEV